MEAMRESWTDERLDDFRTETARRFVSVDQRFDRLERRMDEGFNALNTRLDALQRTMLQFAGVMIAALITLIATQAGLLATQLL